MVLLSVGVAFVVVVGVVFASVTSVVLVGLGIGAFIILLILVGVVVVIVGRIGVGLCKEVVAVSCDDDVVAAVVSDGGVVGW